MARVVKFEPTEERAAVPRRGDAPPRRRKGRGPPRDKDTAAPRPMTNKPEKDDKTNGDKDKHEDRRSGGG